MGSIKYYFTFKIKYYTPFPSKYRHSTPVIYSSSYIYLSFDDVMYHADPPALDGVNPVRSFFYDQIFFTPIKKLPSPLPSLFTVYQLFICPSMTSLRNLLLLSRTGSRLNVFHFSVQIFSSFSSLKNG